MFFLAYYCGNPLFLFDTFLKEMVQTLKILEVKKHLQYIKSGVNRTFTDNLTKDAKLLLFTKTWQKYLSYC